MEGQALLQQPASPPPELLHRKKGHEARPGYELAAQYKGKDKHDVQLDMNKNDLSNLRGFFKKSTTCQELQEKTQHCTYVYKSVWLSTLLN